MKRASEIAARRASFREAHADGMKAIKDGDLPGLIDALRREDEVIGAQAALIEDAKQVAGVRPDAEPSRRRRARKSR